MPCNQCRHLDIVKPVGPRPAVESAIPIPLNIFTYLTGQTNIVRKQSIVLAGAFYPSVRVLQHPTPIFLFAGQIDRRW